GKPVPNATVVDHDALWSARTDEQGAFTIPDPRRWAKSLFVLHPDYALAETGTLLLEIALERGASVSGTVFGSDRRPAAGARLLADGWPVGTTANDGTFTIRRLAAAVKTIDATRGAEYGNAKRAERVDIHLAEGRAIHGTVRDANKRPIAGLRVEAYAQRGREAEVAAAVTDERGSYRIDHRAAETHLVVPADVGELDFAVATANLRTSSSARLDFNAAKQRYLRGTVVDERKRPIAGALVLGLPSQIPLLYAIVIDRDVRGGRTGADGRFRIPVLSEVRVQALHPRYAAALVESPKPDEPMTIVLRDGIEVRGVVTGPDGKPVAGAGIAAIQDPFGAVALPIDSVLSSGYGEPFVETGRDGTFTLRLNAAPHDLAVWKEGYAGFRLGGLTPAAGEPPLRITLDRGAELRGRVVAKKGNPPLLGTISAESDGGYHATAVNADGTFAFASLRPGPYTLDYESTAGVSIRKDASAPAADVVLELPAMAEIRGRVSDKTSGAPIREFNVRTEPGDSESSGDETFAISVEPGPVKVTVRAPGYLPQSIEAVADLEKPAELAFALTRGRTISGRVTSAEGTPLAEATVTTDGAETWDSNQTGDDGEFQLTGMPHEGVTIVVRRSGYITRSIALDAGQSDPRLHVALSRGRRVTGRVVTATGEPVFDAFVWAKANVHDAAAQHTKSASDGTFTLDGLSDARYSFFATRQDLGTAKVPDVEPTVTQLVIAFEPGQGSGAIHGTVQGFTDRAWTYGVVTAGDERAQAVINRDGTFRMDKVPAGEIELRAQAMSARERATTPPVRVTVAPGADAEVTLTFRSDITVRGTVTEGGRAAAGSTVTFSNERQQSSTRTGDDGVYEINGLEAGMYDVTVSGRRREFAARYQLTGSATYDIAIAFAQLAGRVLDGSGTPIAGVTVEARAEGSQSAESATTDAAGAFR
ncbi:MAG TPA: carboxypeptidase-like regulatory domain-containing protein, partial [Thermoanaerobaculia bacterium]|nr:carboxypeptidase-like regulatory domain-containing protein [Thermoanaerobaculia bacterium]